MKRKANVVAATAFILWGSLFLLGRDGAYHVYEQGPGIFPSAGQIDYYIIFPTLVAAVVGCCAWIANAFDRWFAALAVVSVLALVTLLPFMFAYTGGV